MPLRRCEALQDLSRDHHGALLLARGVRTVVPRHLRPDLPSSSEARAAHVCRVFHAELEPHFFAEESVLLAAVEGQDATLDAICAEIRADHRALRALVDELADTTREPLVLEHTLDRFGRLLEAHVRKEERSLYPRIQEVLDDSALARLSALLLRARARVA